MPDFSSDVAPQAPPASLNARKIEQLASRLCSVQLRGATHYCATHGSVVADRSAICGHVRTVVEQVVQAVMDAERVRVLATTDAAPDRAVEVRMGVSA